METYNKKFTEVLVTNDYSMFKKLEGNRALHKGNINNLKKSFSKKQIKIPIIVNEKFEVIDGQHRLQVMTQLSLPVYYLILPNLNRSDTELINTSGANWTQQDYLKAYCELEIEPYQIFRDFIRKYNVTLNIGKEFFYHYHKKQTAIHRFKEGSFKVYDLELSTKLMEQYLSFKGAQCFTAVSFVRALIKLMKHPDYSHERMLRKLKLKKHELGIRNMEYQYYHLLILIYNYRERDIVKFE